MLAVLDANVVEEVPLSSLLLLLVVAVLVDAARLEVLVERARLVVARAVELRGMTPPEPGAGGMFVGRICRVGSFS